MKFTKTLFPCANIVYMEISHKLCFVSARVHMMLSCCLSGLLYLGVRSYNSIIVHVVC